MDISYEEALDIINSKISVVSNIKKTPVLDSIKHICAENIYATTSLPKKPISLKDGYALIDDATDTFYEVSTGDELQENTSKVIPFEDAVFTKQNEIQLEENLPYMYNIKEAGEDIKEGELLMKRGEYIKAYSLTSLVSQGIKSIRVFERAKVSILSIGDNLCPIQKEIKEGEVYNTNAQSLAARVLESGANVQKVWQAKMKKDILECLKDLAAQSDFIITTGAMSRHDVMSKLIYEHTFNLYFHKVKIAPAGPSALSNFENTPILHLPGLPLSALLGFELLGIPTLKTIKNEHLERKNIYIKNAKKFTCKESCTSAIPGFFDGVNFTSAPSFGAGMLNTLAKCNGYALIQDKKTIQKDETIEFYPF